MQVLYLGRAPRTKETLPDFREKCRVTRHSRVFRELTGSQWTQEFLRNFLIGINANVNVNVNVINVLTILTAPKRKLNEIINFLE